jgi:hypothetical protein
VTGKDRPTDCSQDDQPAIVAFVDAAGDERLPVWGCFQACGPGLEYVTVLGRKSTSVACTPVCAPGKHRISYVSVHGATTCDEGPEPSAERAAALAAEQRRMLARFEERRRRALAGVLRSLAALEQRTSAWTEAEVTAWDEARMTLGRIREGGDGSPRSDLATEAAPVAPIDDATARALGELQDRVDKLYRVVRQSERQLEELRRSGDCQQRCDAGERACDRACQSAGRAACETCAVERRTCDSACASR